MQKHSQLAVWCENEKFENSIFLLYTNVYIRTFHSISYYNKNRRVEITTVDSDTVKYCQMSEIYISIYQFNICRYIEIYKIEFHRKTKINTLVR